MPSFALPVPPHWSTRGPLCRTLMDPQQEYLAHAGQLMALVRDGQADSDEAMQLRGRMDAPWARMTAEQQIHVIHIVEELGREADSRVRLRLSR
jgi:hypothetical protein